MKILVTAGATREPLDAVRFLSNLSTGATGAALADEMTQRGHEVVLLRGAASIAARVATEGEIFSTAADLRARLQRQLSAGAFDAVIMAAAVADFRPDATVAGKIASEATDLTLRLVRTEKILPHLKTFAGRPLRVIGFKLTVGADDAARRLAVSRQLSHGGVDAVVHNDLHEIRTHPDHLFWLWCSAAAVPERVVGATALAESLLEFLQRSLA